MAGCRRGVVLLLFLVVCLSHAHEGHDHEEETEPNWATCSRARSRQARAILNEEFYPAVIRSRHKFPRECPLSKDNDIYLDNELHKKEARFGAYRCVYCNKVFKTESFLEKHFENRHVATIRNSAEGTYDGEGARCNPKTMQRRRHRCHSVLDMCFPPHASEVSSTLHHKFEALYCDHLECEDGPAGMAMRAKKPHPLLQVFGVLFLLLLIIFYLGLCLYRKDMTIMADLRKLSGSKRKKRLEMLKAKQF
ncbi:hypothetical protein T484DRAFT_1945444 [Baffinella frigidus]|nr:hypothetical protein T484DRAFT_1945444 [Cryptophyta sp. CCMP2293]